MLDASGDITQFGNTFTTSQLEAMPQDVAAPGQVYVDASGRAISTQLSGSSIGVVLTQLDLPVSAVATVDFLGPGFLGLQELSAAAGDLVANGSTDSPFVDGYAPLFAPGRDVNQSTFDFAVQARKPESADPALAGGRAGFTSPTAPMTMTVHLENRVLGTRVRSSRASLPAGGAVTLTAEVDDAVGEVSYVWHFGDADAAVTTTTPTVSHTYPKAGVWDATVDVVDGTGSKGFATTTVTVRRTAATPTTSAPGPGQGTAATTAPNRGPVVATGPRAGGVPTSRSGPTGAGATFDPRSSGAPSATTTGSATPRAGVVVSGFALSLPSAAVEATRVGATSRNDAAAATRAGSTTNRVGAWVLGGLAVVVLLGLGVLSERRRPRHRGRRTS